jgi:MFS family permease/mono/diheme cytochrome c family protein
VKGGVALSILSTPCGAFVVFDSTCVTCDSGRIPSHSTVMVSSCARVNSEALPVGTMVETSVPARLDRLEWSGWHTRVVIALGITWTLDGLEASLIANLGPVLQEAATLSLSATQVGEANTAYLIGQVFGALVFGRLTDLWGRKRLFLVTLAVYLSATALSGAAPNFLAFAILRFFAGTGIGGEYSAINSAIDELIPARLRGQVDLTINGSYWLGVVLGAGLTEVLLNPALLPHAYGWRLAFGLGGVLGLAIVLVRRDVPESPRWLLMHGRIQESESVMSKIESAVMRSMGKEKPLGEAPSVRVKVTGAVGVLYTARVLLRKYPRRTLLGLSLMIGQAIFYNAIFFTFALILTQFYGIPVDRAGRYMIPFAIGNFLGPALLGRWFDTLGRRLMIASTYVASGILLVATGYAFQQGWLSATTQTLCWCVVFFVASAAASSAYLTVSELFPVEIRGMVIALFYAVATLIGASAPTIFGALVQSRSRLALFEGRCHGCRGVGGRGPRCSRRGQVARAAPDGGRARGSGTASHPLWLSVGRNGRDRAVSGHRRGTWLFIECPSLMRAWFLALTGVVASLVSTPAEKPRLFRIEPVDEAAGPSHTLALGRIEKQALAFVADEDRSAVLTFSLPDRRFGLRFVSRTSLPGKPSSVRLLSNGELAVTLRDRSQVAFLQSTRDGLRITASTDVCTEPVSTNARDDELFVVCAWGHSLDTVSTRTHARIARVDLPREPRAVVLDPSGMHFYVSHAVDSHLSIVDRKDGKLHQNSLSVSGLPAMRLAPFARFGSAEAPFEPGAEPDEPSRSRFATQGFSLAFLSRPSGDRLFLPEVLVSPSAMPTQRRDGTEQHAMRSAFYGGMIVSGPLVRGAAAPYLATFVTKGGAVRASAPPTAFGESRCLLPRAAAVTSEGRVFLTCLGSNEVLEYNGLADEPDLHIVARTRVAQGPTGIAYADEHIYVWSTYERILTRIDNRCGSSSESECFSVASETSPRPPTPFEVGRMLFHRTDSLRISSDGRACASCHPDGREDGLVWSSPDGPRQTPMLAGRLADTPPFGWTGGAATVREHLQQTFARLGGQGLDDPSLYALLTYVAQMAPPPPDAAPSVDAPRIAAGKRIFESYDTGCSGCHDPSRGFTDGELHDVGSLAHGDVKRSFETPSLRGVGGTAPYFHDGRYATLEDLVRKSQTMAETTHLSDADLGDLVSYLRTL